MLSHSATLQEIIGKLTSKTIPVDQGRSLEHTRTCKADPEIINKSEFLLLSLISLQTIICVCFTWCGSEMQTWPQTGGHTEQGLSLMRSSWSSLSSSLSVSMTSSRAIWRPPLTILALSSFLRLTSPSSHTASLSSLPSGQSWNQRTLSFVFCFYKLGLKLCYNENNVTIPGFLSW